MTDKYCPLRFREFGSQPHDQRCIGEYCAWFDKCSQSHGEPIYGMPYGNMEPRQAIATEEPQEPREADENACSQDTREKLEADVGFIVKEGFVTYKSIIGWLDRQAAITDAEWDDELEQLHMGYKSLIDELQARQENYERATMRLQAEKQTLTDLLDDYVAKNDELQAKVEAYEKAAQGEFVVPLEDAMKFTTDPPGYVKAYIAELQAKVDELESLDDGLLDKYLKRGEKITRLREKIAELQAQLDKLSSDELHWHSEADFWKRKYELICKALIDLNRNYVHVEDEGLA